MADLNHSSNQANATQSASETGAASPTDKRDNIRRFKAFISYRHVAPDQEYAKWLQSAIETYRLPRSFARAHGLASKVGRIFRDQEELAASTNLSATIEEALQDSDYLIVVCSPAAAASKWVNAEVEFFLKLGRPDQILSLLIDGEPHEAFPEALRDIDAALTAPSDRAQLAQPPEPLAADVRPLQGGSARSRKRTAKLRLIATMLGVRFDDLRQRDQERRMWQVGSLAAIASIIAVLFAVLAFYAKWQGDEAIAQRNNTIARSLAARSQLLLSQRGTLIDTAALLAVEAMKIAPSLEADQAIRKVLNLLPKGVAEMDCGDVVEGVFSSDGKYLATPGSNETKIWDTGTGKLVTIIPKRITSKSFFRPNNNELAILDDGLVTIWNSTDGSLIVKLSEPNVNTIAYSPDGLFLLIVTSDKLTRLIDASDHNVIGEYINQQEMKDAAIKPQGAEIITYNGNQAEVFRSPGPPAQILPENFEDEFYTYSPDGRYLVRAIPGQYILSLMDAQTQQSLLFQDRHWLSTFSGNSKFFAIGSPEWDASVYDLAPCNRAGERWEASAGGVVNKVYTRGRGSCEVTARVHHDDSVTGVELSFDGRLLATTSRDRTVRVWETATGREALRIDEVGKNNVKGVKFNREGTHLSTWGTTGCLTWEATGQRQVAALEHDDAITSVSFSGDGSRVATVEFSRGDSPTARVWTVPDGQEIARLQVSSSSLHSVALDGNGEKLLLDNDSVWQVRSRKKLYNLATHGSGDPSATKTSLSGDWKIGTAVVAPNTVIVYNTLDGQETARKTFSAPIRTLGITLDGCCVAIATTEGKVILWKYMMKEEREVEVSAKVSNLVFDGTGSLLAVVAGEQANMVQIFRLGEEWSTALLIHQETEIKDVAFDPTGHYLATAGDDRTARIWNLDNGAIAAQFVHDADVDSIAFSPDGKYVLSGGGRSDRTARLWLWRPNDLIGAVCSRLAMKGLSEEEWGSYVGQGLVHGEVCPSSAPTGRN